MEAPAPVGAGEPGPVLSLDDDAALLRGDRLRGVHRVLVGEAPQYPRRVDRLAKIFAGYGVGPGGEVVISGGCDLKGAITGAVRRLGGELRASVTQKIKLLVSADKPGAKLAKAMELGVTIVFAENLRRIMKTNPLEE